MREGERGMYGEAIGISFYRLIISATVNLGSPGRSMSRFILSSSDGCCASRGIYMVRIL